MKSLIIILTLGIFVLFSYNVQAADDKDTPEAFESEKDIAMGAQKIASKRLSKNPKDPVAIKLVDLSNHLYPNYEPLLLLRARLKYNQKIPTPKKDEFPESKFISLLKEKAATLSKKNTIRNRHLCLVYYQVIRLFEPDNETALIQLMKFDNEGEKVDLTATLKKKYSQLPFDELDPKDPRYAVGNVSKTIKVLATDEWTDSWIKVEKGKVIKIEAKRLWSLIAFDEEYLPYTDADGYEDSTLQEMLDKARKDSKGTKRRPGRKIPSFVNKYKFMNPGCLLVKVGETVYPGGKEVTIRPKNAGIVYLGPFEWDTYMDNKGYLLVTITVSDK